MINKFKLLFVLCLSLLLANSMFAQVNISEISWKEVGCYRIETPMGTVYFEKDNGVSGFKSFIDNEENDWIASYLPPGPHGEYRGFPNSPGNFGHAGRNSNSTTIIVDDKTEGEFVVLESWNENFKYQYWFFPTHISIKVLQSKGDYCFLYEGVPGGTADSTDFFITADGVKHLPIIEGEFDDFTPEWFLVGDESAQDYMFMAKTPNDDAPNENHRQIEEGQHNMDLYSFGRAGIDGRYCTYGMGGTEHVCVIGFISKDNGFNKIASFIETILGNSFEAVR